MMPIDPRRRTGRSTRARQEAFRLAREGKAVVLVVSSEGERRALAAEWTRESAKSTGKLWVFSVYNMSFSWHSWSVPGLRADDIIFDHYALEKLHGRITSAMTRFDRQEHPTDRRVLIYANLGRWRHRFGRRREHTSFYSETTLCLIPFVTLCLRRYPKTQTPLYKHFSGIPRDGESDEEATARIAQELDAYFDEGWKEEG